MNFKYMPELNWHYSYFAFIGISLIVTITLILFLKRKIGYDAVMLVRRRYADDIRYEI